MKGIPLTNHRAVECPLSGRVGFPAMSGVRAKAVSPLCTRQADRLLTPSYRAYVPTNSFPHSRHEQQGASCSSWADYGMSGSGFSVQIVADGACPKASLNRFRHIFNPTGFSVQSRPCECRKAGSAPCF